MPAILHQYMAVHNDIEIEVQVLESREISGSILAGNADLGLSRLHIQHPELVIRPLYQDMVIMVVPHDGGDSESSPPLDAEEILANQILITHNHPEYWDDLLRNLRQYTRLRTMVVSEVHVTKRFIEEGLGVSFLPISTVRRELLEGRLLEVDFRLFPLPIARTYVIMKYEHSIQKHFLDFLGKFRLP
ncbi:DNA-binding transcriptional LysR family regulator [Peribacillus deserti]|uniref:DNA-binding transcriptional LysR family regulator n=1 Tax=Peribacillus deserti TaxID=673318 RepID=A0ABS2QN84_9BACI|nr:DNA-binding transcriptional LysR family regulator [Peribacillus deserti]